MKGSYDRGPTRPLAEHSIARQLEWQSGLDTIKCVAIAVIMAASIGAIAVVDQNSKDLCISLWMSSAALLLCASGRVNANSWKRWSDRTPSLSGYYSHRARRLAPVYLASLAIVLVTISTLITLGQSQQIQIGDIAQNILPLFPNYLAAQYNPSWIIIQVAVAGALLTPALVRINSDIAKLVIIGGSAAIISISLQFSAWSTYFGLLLAYGLGVLTCDFQMATRLSRRITLLLGSVLIGVGQIVGAITDNMGLNIVIAAGGALLIIIAITRSPIKHRIARHYAYPALIFHYPIILLASRLWPTSNSAGMIIGILLSMIIIFLAGRIIEKSNDKEIRKRAELTHAHTGSDFDLEIKLSYHPERGDNS